MLRFAKTVAVTFAGGGVYPERSRGTRRVEDTVQIHLNTILAAREAFGTTDEHR